MLTSFVNNSISLQGPRAGLDELEKWIFLTLSELVPVESLLHTVQTGSGVHLASYAVGTGALSARVNRAGCETDRSPPTSDEVKKMWIYVSTPQYVFLA
jgi:hypothetical protein